MTAKMWLASIAWLLLVMGYIGRHNRARHVPLMISGIAIDVTLVLYLQVTRSAIQTALAFELQILQQIHIGVSTVALLLYFPIAYLGSKLLCGRSSPQQRLLHIRLGTAALIFRTLGFIFMFSMWRS